MKSLSVVTEGILNVNFDVKFKEMRRYGYGIERLEASDYSLRIFSPYIGYSLLTHNEHPKPEDYNRFASLGSTYLRFYKKRKGLYDSSLSKPNRHDANLFAAFLTSLEFKPEAVERGIKELAAKVGKTLEMVSAKMRGGKMYIKVAAEPSAWDVAEFSVTISKTFAPYTGDVIIP